MGSLVEIRNLHVQYGLRTVIDDLSLVVRPSEKILLSGPNGCGKTTLLRCMMKLQKISGGSILIDGGSDSADIAYCKQETGHSNYPLSAREVVAIGAMRRNRSERREIVEFALDQTGCSKLAGRNFFSLSGGEKQRVSLARCLAQDPSLLLLDEPTSFLDEEGCDSVLNVLNSLDSRQMTVIAVTHDLLMTRRLGWKVLRMDKGGVQWAT